MNIRKEQPMNIQKKRIILLGTMLAFLVMLPMARASDENQATKVTFNQAVQIPGRILPAGTYWFVLANPTSSPDVIYIFNSDRSALQATVRSITAERVSLIPANDAAVTLVERESMQPETIVTWYYADDNIGHEFVYSKPEAQELAQLKHHTLVIAARVKHDTRTAAARG
jgi:hypothetical protein